VTSTNGVSVGDAMAAVKSWFHSQTERSLVVFDSTSNALTSNLFLPDASMMDVVIAMRYAQAAEIATLRAVKVVRQLALDFDNTDLPQPRSADTQSRSRFRQFFVSLPRWILLWVGRILVATHRFVQVQLGRFSWAGPRWQGASCSKVGRMYI